MSSSTSHKCTNSTSLGLWGVAAQRIFGVFNIEWVHFAWNTWILVAVVLLVRAFRTNPWLWVTLVAAVWHELEHVAIMGAYITTGVAGTPGLLAHGGLIGRECHCPGQTCTSCTT